MAKIAEVLTVDCMSSEESDVDQETNRVKQYYTRQLPWESNKLRHARTKSDKIHHDSLPGLVHRQIVPREVGPQ